MHAEFCQTPFDETKIISNDAIISQNSAIIIPDFGENTGQCSVVAQELAKQGIDALTYTIPQK